MSADGAGARAARPPEPVRRHRPWGIALLVALAYLPALTAAPGRMPSDTKLYLYLDPARLIADAPRTWDVRQFAGWVPHQTIAYLWPSGPWFWTFDQLGVPDWVAHRLWIGTLLLAAGLGVRWAARHLGLAATGATVAGVVYMTSPYLLPYVSRTSVMLLPWAGLGWLVGLTVRATTRTRWRDAGLFGLVVVTIGAVNAAALALVAPAPMLWLLHAAWQRSITWRAAAVTAAKLGGISLAVSMWWIVMLVVQGRHGADVLAFSETQEAVSLTAVSTEVLRGLGYWLFYVRDPYAATTTASLDYLASTRIVLVGYLLLALCLLGIAVVRWSQRRFAALLVTTGVVLAVGVHPIDDPSPLMRPLAGSGLGLALRSSTRALPLATLGLALGAGALVVALGGASAGRRLPARLRTLAPDTGAAVRAAGACVLVALAVANLPALWRGGLVDPALERDQDVPAAWREAAAALDDAAPPGGPHEHRVLQLPGAEFGAFRWGYTVDPPLPGLADTPLVTRDLLPLGTPGAMDLLYALDTRFQAGVIDPAAIAPVARFLGASTIWVAGDAAFDRFRTPRPEVVKALYAAVPDGLAPPRPFGEPTVNEPDVAMVDEQLLGDPAVGAPVAPVELVPVVDPVGVSRVGAGVVVLAGSGDGIVDAAAAGLLTGREAVVYVADLGRVRDHVSRAGGEAAAAGAATLDDSPLVVTDANRARAMQWRGSQDVVGFTEAGGPEGGLTRADVADQRLAVFTEDDPAQQTLARLEGGLVVRASGYGEPFAYRPEDRPAMAVDGDPSTAWRVGDRADPVGESIVVSRTDGTLRLLQPQRAEDTRRIAAVTVTAEGAAPVRVELGQASLVSPGQDVAVPAGVPVAVTIEAVAAREGGTDPGASAVGFAELGPVAAEVVHVPAAAAVELARAPERPLAVVLTRERVRPTDRWRSDPERALVREVELPVQRSFEAEVELRLAARADDAVLAAVGGVTGGAVADRRLTGVPAAVGAAALDGDPATSWTTPFGGAVGAGLDVPLRTGEGGAVAAGATAPWRIVQPLDGLHSLITEVTLTVPGVDAAQVVPVPPPDATGASTFDVAPLVGADGGPAARVVVTISAVSPATTVDRRWAEVVELPAAIVELQGPAVAAPRRVDPPACHRGLITVDGAPVGVRFGAEAAAALAEGRTVVTTLCDGPLDLGPGSSRITAAPGLRTGIDVDRVTLRSGIEGAAAADTQPVSTLQVRRDRTTRTVTVGPCPEGCWLILGEGFNAAWDAQVVSGGRLGRPTQVSGGFNGWWLGPSTDVRTVQLTWTPERSLRAALAVAAAAVAACLLLVVADRRRTGAASPVHGATASPRLRATASPRLRVVPPLADRAAAVGAAVVLVAGAGLLIAPLWAALALAPAAVVLRWRRPAALAAAGAVLSGILGLVVAWRVHEHRWFPDAGWPSHVEDLHRAGLFVVVLLLAGCLGDDTHGGVEAAQASDAATNDPATHRSAIS